MLTAGAASRVINGELGRPIQGATVDRCAESVRDDLEANALFLRSDDATVLLISCDLAGIVPEVTADVREAASRATGIPARNIIVAATHTHSGPSVISTNYTKPVDVEYLTRLPAWLTDLATEAVEGASPCRVAWGVGAARIGYNRRCCWADGSHTMHGDSSRHDFVGLEGPDDPQHAALFVEDEAGKLLAIAHANTCHPTCFYGDSVYSADFPGEARKYLRNALGPLPVLYLNGAFGDISITNQLAAAGRGETREQKLQRAAHLIAGETLRLLHETRFSGNVLVRHAHEDLRLGVRLPTEQRREWARATLARVDAGERVPPWDAMFAHGVCLLQDEFGCDPFDTVAVHAIRVGDVGIATQPCELFCQFGLDIRRRSPSPHTILCGIADGYSGYCPTTAGALGGGYSGEPLHWTRLAGDAGYRITDAAARLLRRLW